jgi:hypothetical protein
MRWMIVNTDYDPFIADLYRRRPRLHAASYDQQLAVRMATRFGTSDFYSHHLRELGHEARDIVANNAPLQMRWAREHGVGFTPARRWRFRLRRGLVPWLAREGGEEWLEEILAAQVRAYRPDVFYCHAIERLGGAFARRIRPHCGCVVGQHAAELPHQDFEGYDLLVSSLPNLVARFRAAGVASEYVPLAFEERVLADLRPTPRRYDVAFVGGLADPEHAPGVRLLERLAERCHVAVWGYGAHKLPADSPLRRTARPPIFGLEMFQALAAARIVFNRHSAVAGPHANNMRLYEATGVGAALLTDEKSDLHALFTPGVEVATYCDAEDCIAQVAALLADEPRREALARAGQQRTLREHTYRQRVPRIVAHVAALFAPSDARSARRSRTEAPPRAAAAPAPALR